MAVAALAVGFATRRRARSGRTAARAQRGPRGALPVRRDERHRGQRPLRRRTARGHRQRQRRHGLEQRARPDAARAATAARPPRSGCRTPCWPASTTSRSPTTCGCPAPRSRVPCSRSARTADNGGSLTATPGAGTTRHQASIAGPGASPVGPDRGRARGAARQHVEARRRDGQGRRRARRPASCCSTRTAR